MPNDGLRIKKGYAEMAENTQIHSVAKALSIINLLAEKKQGMSLAEISRKMGMAKSTAHGLISTLRDFGYIEQSVFNGNYKLGIALFEVGCKVANNIDVREIASDFIQQLVDEIGETIHLVVLDRDEVLYIDKHESTQSLRIVVSEVGARLPVHCTGVGKVLLAHLPSAEVKRIVKNKGLKRYTKNTITDIKRLEKELAVIREQGYGEDREEIMDSLRCIAVPIWDYTNKVCAAMSISGPCSRMTDQRICELRDHLLAAAREISASLGYRPKVGGECGGA
jgi:DNA-binding IclR family transcriptional regulator